MAKYYYDNKKECYIGGGRPIYVNKGEASRIANLVNLGYNSKRISDKVSLSSPKSGKTTVSNFVKHYRDGEIKVSNIQTEKGSSENKKVAELEDRIKGLEKMIAEMNKDDESEPTLSERLKRWLNR